MYRGFEGKANPSRREESGKIGRQLIEPRWLQVGSAEHSARLNVYGLPFIRHMDKKAIVAGETLRVTCPVAGYPIESIVWERDTRVLPINRKQKVFPNGTLIIENVERMSDQATYTCVARNAQGYSARGTLEVQVMGKFLCSFLLYNYKLTGSRLNSRDSIFEYDTCVYFRGC